MGADSSLPGMTRAVLLCCLLAVLVNLAHAQQVSSQCTIDLQRLGNNSYTRSDLLHDSTGSGNYGFFAPMKGYFDPGKWTVCESRMYEETDASQYCYMNVSNLFVGACVPASCSTEDLNSLPSQVVASALHLPLPFYLSLTADCKTADYDIPWGTWVFVSVYAVLISLLVIGSLVDAQLTYNILPLSRRGSDLENESDEEAPKRPTKLEDKHPNLVVKLLLSFSFQYNYGRLVAPSPPGSMDVLNGVRVMAMMFVVMGHTFYRLWDSMAILNFQSVANTVQNLRFQVVIAGLYAVDTFFWLSGFLVAYLFIRELQGRGLGLKMMFMFYFHRIYRLTPSLVVGVFFYYLIVPYWTDGPYWLYMQRNMLQCKNNWWWTLLYVQNITPRFGETVCLGWSWYLADDMQYYFVSPLVLIAYWKNKWVGWGLTLLGIWICLLSNLWVCIFDDVQEFQGIEYGAELSNYVGPTGNYGQLIYLPPWTRVAPYLIGFICAFILLERGKNFRVNQLARGLVYTLSTSIVLVCTFITWSDANYGWTSWMNTIWITFSRTFWSIGLGSLLLICVAGYGGIFTRFMSQDFWVPFARLSYGAYIFHLSNIETIYGGYKGPLTFFFSIGMYFFFGHLIIAFMLAFVNYFLVEKPLMNIESILLHRKPRVAKEA